MFGRKGNDFVFKIGNGEEAPKMLSAEDALKLFAAEPSEEPVELSDYFDATYQKVKNSLFKGEANDHNEKDVLNALAKIKVFSKAKLLNKDYLDDLLTVVKADALSGHEIRYINQLSVKNVKELPKKIPNEYLARIIITQNSVDEGEETLILSEELQK